MIVVIVTNVEGKVPINSLKRAGTIQTTRATSADASFDRIFRQMLDHVTGAAAGGRHANRVPPRSVHSHRWMGEIACKEQHRFRAAGVMASAAWSCSAHQQDGPMRPASAGGKSFCSIYDVTAINFGGCGSELYGF